MCGRFAQAYELQEFIRRFGVAVLDGVGLRYNIAPTQSVLVLLHDPESKQGMRPRMLRWGLVPHWAQDPAIGNRMINARGESAATKPSFRASFRNRRCVVPASGFFEWRRGGGRKTPYYFYLANSAPMAMAGLWARWRDPVTEEPLETFTILTVAANPDVAEIHDRMPVLLPPGKDRDWVNPKTPQDGLHALIAPPEAGQLAKHPVASIVNSPVNDNPACITPLPETPELFEDI